MSFAPEEEIQGHSGAVSIPKQSSCVLCESAGRWSDLRA